LSLVLFLIFNVIFRYNLRNGFLVAVLQSAAFITIKFLIIAPAMISHLEKTGEKLGFLSVVDVVVIVVIIALSALLKLIRPKL
jgi:hypothetical protein